MVSSWLMNNLHFTNFQSVQEGSGRYRYQFELLDEAPNHAQVRAYGRQMLQPLQARVVENAPDWDQTSGFWVEPPSVLAEPRIDAAGGVNIRLRNVTGEPVTATVGFTLPGDLPDSPTRRESRLQLPAFGVGQVKWQG
jgi:hypothetical protein